MAILALTRNHRQTRTWLQDRLWSDRGPAQGAASLRQALTSLRGILNGAEEVLRADRTWVWLEPSYFHFDHETESAGEILRGFDIRDEGFGEWLREVRAEFETRNARWGPVEIAEQLDRAWHIDLVEVETGDIRARESADLTCDAFLEALTVLGIQTVVDRREACTPPSPRATDLVVRVRAQVWGRDCIISVNVTDGFGALQWQIRREATLERWSDLRGVLFELSRLFQDFAIRSEAARLRGARWSAHTNTCQALMGVVAPGSVPIQEIAQCSEAAMAANEQGIHHALLGFSRLLLFGERESMKELDADAIMQAFRTAMRMSPGNGLVQALAGHAFGFLLHDFDRNSEMTSEAVRLLPGSGPCRLFHSISLVYCGRYGAGVKAAATAVSACRGTLAYPMACSSELYARLMAGDNDGAIHIGEIAMETSFFRPTIVDLMTAYARAGRLKEGRRKLRLLHAREPELSVDMLRSDAYPIVNSTHRVAVAEAARRLGLR
ncbi:MAG: hypothetical protein AAF713_21495 [Pseudomonadota bacterium]